MSLTVITLEKNSITQTLHKARGWEGLQATGFWSHGQNYANAAFPTTDWSCGSWLCSDTSVQQTSSEMLHQVFAWSIFDPGILLKTSTDSMSPRGRLVMADVRQLRWLQGWKDGHDRWSQLQDSTDFDQCIWDPRIAHEILWTKKKPAVCRWSCSSGELPQGFWLLPSVTSKTVWWVHAIMQFHSQSVGWSCFLDGDCLDTSPGADWLHFRAAYRPGLKLLLWSWLGGLPPRLPVAA